MKVNIEVEAEKVQDGIVDIKTRMGDKLVHHALLDFTSGTPNYMYDGVKYAVDKALHEVLRDEI